MLVHKVNDKIEVHQVKYNKFAILFNGHVVQTSQDLDNLVEWSDNNVKEIEKRGRQIAKAAKIQMTHDKMVEQAKSMSRNEFIATQLIEKTKRSNDDKLIKRQDGKFDICFMNMPTWSNIDIRDIEIWTGRTGLCRMSREARDFWMDANV